MEKIRTIFIGTPDFSVPSLRALIKDKQFDIVAVITQPDKKAGRKQVITPSPVKTEAKKNNITVLQPQKISDSRLEIKDLKPSLIIVIAYAQIIPETILKIPKYGVINIHGSLLPKYRGASCIQAAILNGDKKTGVTIMKVDKGLDTGPVLSQSEIDISSSDTTETLYIKLSKKSAKILPSTLKEYIAGKIKPTPQNNLKASYVGILKKKDGEIDWQKSAIENEKFVRAMTSWPSAFAKIKNKKQNIKILKVENKVLDIDKYKIGELFLDNNKLAVQCTKSALIIKRLQLEGKKEMNAEEFIHGRRNYIGVVLE